MNPERQRIEIVHADITTFDGDAIVNAANSRLRGGGGVDGAIHRAAGPELRTACLALGGCPTGEARITPGFRLPARYVIHAVGPVYHDGRSKEAELLASCYRSSLRLAGESGLKSIAFSALSTGVYGYPFADATRIAVRTIIAELAGAARSVERVVLVFFSEAHFAAAKEILAEFRD